MHLRFVSARPRAARRVRRFTVAAASGLLAVGLLGAQAGGAQASTVPAAGTAAKAHGGTGTSAGAVASVDLSRISVSADKAPPAPNAAQQAAMARPAAARPALASKAGTGTKPGAPATVRPQVAPPVFANFPGIDLTLSGCGCQPPDPNAAVGVNEIVETVNTRFEVYNKAGAALCGIGFNAFFGGTADILSDPRVMYDNVNGRYLGVMTIVPASASATPAIWVFATQTNNPCGGWWIFRPTFAGGSFPAGTLLDYPILGQDRNAMLLSTDNFPANGGQNFTVFTIPKSALYTGGGFSFTAFNTASFTAPASNGGIPMINTQLDYFLGAVPGSGYRLYNLTNSGGPGAVLTLQANVACAFNPPPRRVNQPGTTTTLDPLDGRIQWSPVNDGIELWFAQGIAIGSFPGVRYGDVSLTSNTCTVNNAFRSGTSDDFNPSISLGNNAGGADRICVNWAYTDSSAGVATSDTVDCVNGGAGIPPLIGTGVVLVNGSITGETRFGDYSSVALDPVGAGGNCFVTAQQYFEPSGNWTTRIGRLGTC